MADNVVEIRPPEQGKWIYSYESNIFLCSKCGGGAVRNDFPFCHWCGSPMKGDSRDE